MNENQFREHIQLECTKVTRQVVKEMIKDPNMLNVGCIDSLTSKGDWNIPGGMVFVWLEYPELFEEFFRRKSGKGGVFFIHLYCGYLHVKCGLDSCEDQKTLINEFSDLVSRLNTYHGSFFTVCMEEDGSAKEYMTVV